MQQILSNNSYLVNKELSLGKYCAYPSDPLERGMIVNYIDIYILYF